ncbi:MAG: hypothetical protein AAF288_08930 [Planctomycetota bacterium]
MDNWLNQASDLTPWIPWAGLLVAMVVGLWTWLLGARLIKPAMVVCGVALGLAGGAAVGSTVAADSNTFLTIMALGGALAGLLVSLLLFRLWVGMAAGIVAALAAPAVVLAWQGPPEANAPDADPSSAQSAKVQTEASSADPQVEAPALSSSEAEPGQAEGAVRGGVRGEGQGESLAQGFVDLPIPEGLAENLPDNLPTDGQQAVEQAQAAAQQVWDTVLQRNLDSVWNWWRGVSAQTQKGVYLGAGVAGVLGLLLGLAMPKTMAGLLASAVGGAILYFAGREAAVRQWPDVAEQWPTSPRATVVMLGLITVLGVLLQWALRRRRSDDRK